MAAISMYTLFESEVFIMDKKNALYNVMIGNEACLSVIDDKSNSDSEKLEGSVKKFIKSASVLGKDSFLGFQITFDKKGKQTEKVFSNKDCRVSGDDYNWIFSGWRKAGTIDDGNRALFNSNMKHYVIGVDQVKIKKDKEAADLPFPPKNSLWFYSDRKNIMENMKGNYQNLKRAMMESKAVMSFLAGGYDGNECGSENIIISFPGEISVRLRTLVALAFPELNIIEIESEESLSKYRIPAFVLGNIMVCQLKTFAEKDSKDRKRNIARKEFYMPGDDSGFEDIPLYDNYYDPFSDSYEEDVYEEDVQGKKKSYYDRLDELIGLTGVKKHVKNIVAFARMKNIMTIMKKKNEIPLALNMGFVGNPGTAKTTVARILAGLLYEIGMLESKEILEVGRADLVAIYEGQTADNVKNVFRRARGRLLFIDEAYSLLEYWEGAYGDEAINTIVQEMENHRNETVVVFAGYPNEMEKFFDRNPGLRSRVPFIINFDDYTADELIGITELEAKKRGFTVNKKAKTKLKSLYSMDNEKIRGNGRYCRNVVERAILSYASRLFGTEGEGGVSNFIITDKDIVVEPTKSKKMIKKIIGFSA